MIIEAGRVAVVTGAAQGLGRALATGLVERGAAVVLADTAGERLYSTAEDLAARGAQVLPVITDVRAADAVNALAARTLDHFGRVDVVVNNAGVALGGGRPLWRTDPQDWQRVLEVNLLGVMHGIQAFVPHLVTAGSGHVVNIASVAGLAAMPFGGPYCASKHAVVAVSETLHSELAILGLPIGVTVACPGFVRTRMTEGLLASARTDGRDDAAEDQLAADMSQEQREQLRQLWAGVERGATTLIEPDVAAGHILAAVEAGRLYALTHGDYDNGVRHRVEGILAALDGRR